MLLGESGSGKTHLMRAFRGRVHGAERGYCAYMQMTAFTGAVRPLRAEQRRRVARPAVLRAASRPARPWPGSRRSSPIRSTPTRRDALERLREGELDQPALDAAVGEAADALIRDPKFAEVDVYLLQALLYLQSGDPAVKARVLKYLRCEDLNDHDRRLLGGIVPCTYADAPHWMIERIGKLIWAVERVPLVLCVDQLEDVFDLDEAALKFRKAMAVLCDVVSRLPSAVVVISCLENFYDELKSLLTRSTKDRVENDPRPVSLQTPCDLDEVRALIGRRLRHLFEAGGDLVPAPTSRRSRSPRRWCRGWSASAPATSCSNARRTASAASRKGRWPPTLLRGRATRAARTRSTPSGRPTRSSTTGTRSGRSFEPAPTSRRDRAGRRAGRGGRRRRRAELSPARAIACQVEGRFVTVDDGRRASAGGRLQQVAAGGRRSPARSTSLTTRAEDRGAVAVALRSTAFPANPKTGVFRLLEAFDQNGGRRATVEDSDWRTMAAFARFRAGREADPAFDSWRKRTRPLTSLESLRTILDLDRPVIARGPGRPPGEPWLILEQEQDHVSRRADHTAKPPGRAGGRRVLGTTDVRGRRPPRRCGPGSCSRSPPTSRRRSATLAWAAASRR